MSEVSPFILFYFDAFASGDVQWRFSISFFIIEQNSCPCLCLFVCVKNLQIRQTKKTRLCLHSCFEDKHSLPIWTLIATSLVSNPNTCITVFIVSYDESWEFAVLLENFIQSLRWTENLSINAVWITFTCLFIDW